MSLKSHLILSNGWIYRGEGNANIVLSIPQTHQIVRIKKYEKSKTILAWFFDWILHIFKWDFNKDIDNEKRNLEFYNSVMITLIGRSYAHPAISFNLSRSEIQKLNKELLFIRPENRNHKHLQSGEAFLFTDYAYLPLKWSYLSFSADLTYAVEIKPKQGWIPPSENNFNKCPFCLNQFLKLNSSKIKQLSSYCPLDLFSGNKKRITKALKSLIINPQNNFKVFVQGIYYYGENVPIEIFYNLLTKLFGQKKHNNINSFINSFCDLMEQALLRNFFVNDGCINCDNKILSYNNSHINEIQKNKCLFSNVNLPKGCVLERILSLQKLNNLGLQKYHDVIKTLNKNNFQFDDWSYVGKFLGVDNIESVCFKCCIEGLQPVEGTAVCSDLNLIPYLVSAIANDCSFMITFRKISTLKGVPKHLVVNINDTNFLINIGVFDLFPKPSSTVEKHMKRRINLQNIFASLQVK